MNDYITPRSPSHNEVDNHGNYNQYQTYIQTKHKPSNLIYIYLSNQSINQYLDFSFRLNKTVEREERLPWSRRS